MKRVLTITSILMALLWASPLLVAGQGVTSDAKAPVSVKCPANIEACQSLDFMED